MWFFLIFMAFYNIYSYFIWKKDEINIDEDAEYEFVIMRNFKNNPKIFEMIKNQEICPCCREELDVECLCGFNCTHLYHKNCISEWLDIKRTCPMCNKEI